MMSMCLNKSLTASAKASLLTYRNEYTFNGVEYAPLMYKIIMHLATIDSVAITQTLRDNLQNLGVFAVTVKGDVDKINTFPFGALLQLHQVHRHQTRRVS